MQEEDWPIRLAAEQLREMLSAVARSEELNGAFVELDRNHTLAAGSHNRRQRCFYGFVTTGLTRTAVLGPDIEGLTDVVLAAVAKSERDAATRQLTWLGVREEVQLGWILSRVGYRIVDDQVVPAG